jgi:hypothetical protein
MYMYAYTHSDSARRSDAQGVETAGLNINGGVGLDHVGRRQSDLGHGGKLGGSRQIDCVLYGNDAGEGRLGRCGAEEGHAECLFGGVAREALGGVAHAAVCV